MNKYAGEGNIGHIMEEIKIDIETNKERSWFKMSENKTNISCNIRIFWIG
jgi:hypothetical protein